MFGLQTIARAFGLQQVGQTAQTGTRPSPKSIPLSRQQKGATLQQNWYGLGWTIPTLARHTGIPEATLEALSRGDSVNLSHQQISALAPAISRYEKNELGQVTHMLASLK